MKVIFAIGYCLAWVFYLYFGFKTEERLEPQEVDKLATQFLVLSICLVVFFTAFDCYLLVTGIQLVKIFIYNYKISSCKAYSLVISFFVIDVGWNLQYLPMPIIYNWMKDDPNYVC